MEGLKLFAVFALIVVLLWRRQPIGPVVAGGSVLLGLLYGAGPLDLLGMAGRATKSYSTLELMAVLILIGVMEHLLGEQGYLGRTLKGLKGLTGSRRVVLAALPAFIGLMPSAGGSILSAPLVDQAAAGTRLTASDKCFVNYYFRHIWEYFVPLYPGILLASRLTDIPLPTLIASFFPYGVLIVLLGLPSLKHLPADAAGEAEVTAADKRAAALDLLASILPILVVLALVFARVNIVLAVGVVLTYLAWRHGYGPASLLRLARRAVPPKLLLAIWSIMFFKQVLIDAGAVESLPRLAASLPVPSYVVLTILSFMVGLITGVTTGYVGVTFPLAMAAGGGSLDLPLATLIFVAGFSGHMLTPMHVCLPLTLDYFKADLGRVLRLLAGPELALLALGFVAYLVF